MTQPVEVLRVRAAHYGSVSSSKPPPRPAGRRRCRSSSGRARSPRPPVARGGGQAPGRASGRGREDGGAVYPGGAAAGGIRVAPSARPDAPDQAAGRDLDAAGGEVQLTDDLVGAVADGKLGLR